MELNNGYLLNRFFTRSTLKTFCEEMLDEIYINTATKYVNEPIGKNNSEVISEIYKKLNMDYRNEYYYKNTLLNKLLLGVHSVNTTSALSEIPINRSKADFILINGKAVVYEIKTDLDNFDRLETQIRDYYKAFMYVSVVTSESNYEAISKKLESTDVGIYVLTKKNTISPKKRPVENQSCLDSNIMFKILRKAEYENIIMCYYGELPNVSQFEYYKACKKLFENIDLRVSHKFFTEELKNRKKVDKDFFLKIPHEIKSLVYFSDLSKLEYMKLDDFLNKPYGG